MNFLDVLEFTSDSTDWDTMMTEDDWQEQHNKHKVQSSKFKILNVIAATCCEGGRAMLWEPLNVGFKT